MKTKTFTIEGYDKKFTVRELKVKEILGLFASVKEEGLSSVEDFVDAIQKDFLPLAGNVTFEDIEELAPSDVQKILDNFLEVNNAFFAMARKMGMNNIMEEFKNAIIQDFGNFVVDSSKRAMLTS